MVDFWLSLDAAGEFPHEAMVDFWCFCIVHAKTIHDGMVDFWLSLDASRKFPHDGMVDVYNFCIARARNIHVGVVDFWSSWTQLGNFCTKV